MRQYFYNTFILIFISIILLTSCSWQANENYYQKKYNINKLAKDWQENPNGTYENVCTDKSINQKELRSIENSTNSKNTLQNKKQVTLKKKVPSNKTNIDLLSNEWHKHIIKTRDNTIGRYCIYVPPEDDDEEEEYNPIYEKLKKFSPRNRSLLNPRYYPLYFGQE